MPTMRKDIKRSKFSSFGTSKWAARTSNVEYFAKAKEACSKAFSNSNSLNTLKYSGASAKTKRSVAANGVGQSKYASYRESLVSAINESKKSLNNSGNVKRPTMRGAIPKGSVYTQDQRFSLTDDGVVNARLNYQRGLKMAASIMPSGSQDAAKNGVVTPVAGSRSGLSLAGIGQGIGQMGSSIGQNVGQGLIGGFAQAKSMFDGNAARELEPEYSPPQPQKKEKKKQKKYVKVVPGKKPDHGVFQSSALSPALLTLTKFLVAFVLVVAIASFVRIGLTTATVSNGISSKAISSQISDAVNTKAGLEVTDSTFGNTTRIRGLANSFGLVSPSVYSHIVLPKDVLVYDEDTKEVSLVDSLGRLSGTSNK